MNASRFARGLLLVLCLLVIAASVFAQAQQPKEEFQPQVGQSGKDVVWVPTPQALVEKMLDMAKVTPQDFLIDLGSGDGRTVITAAKRGVRAMGIEFNPDMVALSKRNAAKEGVSDKATFVQADLFATDLSQATVITMFLLPKINLKLRPKLLDLKPGTRIVSNTFTMGEWKADETAKVDNDDSYWRRSLLWIEYKIHRIFPSHGDDSYWHTALFWIVPTKVGGTWKLPQGELALKQEFQKFSGTLKSDRNSTPITDGRLRGDQISFSAGGAQYTGRVNGDTMEGTLSSGGNTTTWSATRAAVKQSN